MSAPAVSGERKPSPLEEAAIRTGHVKPANAAERAILRPPIVGTGVAGQGQPSRLLATALALGMVR